MRVTRDFKRWLVMAREHCNKRDWTITPITDGILGAWRVTLKLRYLPNVYKGNALVVEVSKHAGRTTYRAHFGDAEVELLPSQRTSFSKLLKALEEPARAMEAAMRLAGAETAMDRATLKAFNFGLQYGMGSANLLRQAAGFGLPQHTKP